MNGSRAQNLVAESMSGSVSLAATIRRVSPFRILDFILIPSHYFQLLSQNPMQPNKQSKCGDNQNHCVKCKHANLESEVTFLQAEEHVRFFAAAIIVLFHLSL